MEPWIVGLRAVTSCYLLGGYHRPQYNPDLHSKE
jgi:hypothetical protein